MWIILLNIISISYFPPFHISHWKLPNQSGLTEQCVVQQTFFYLQQIENRPLHPMFKTLKYCLICSDVQILLWKSFNIKRLDYFSFCLFLWFIFVSYYDENLLAIKQSSLNKWIAYLKIPPAHLKAVYHMPATWLALHRTSTLHLAGSDPTRWLHVTIWSWACFRIWYE